MQKYDIAIIGGGAAGMMAAIFASQKKKVVLIEKNNILGRKILATGNGRCNLMNLDGMNDAHYYGADSSFVSGILSQFKTSQTKQFFESIGLILKEEDNGRIFPITNSAKSVVDLLCHKLYDNKVDIKLNCEVKNIEKKSAFKLVLATGVTILADKLIITTGGKAAYYLGSSGDGIFWAKKMGHNIIPVYASLVPLEIAEKSVANLQGLKMYSLVSVVVDQKIISQKKGDLLFTHFGVSGPAVMGQSRLISPYVSSKKIRLEVDLLPDISRDMLDKMICQLIDLNSKKLFKNNLVGLLPENLISVLLAASGVDGNKKSAEISKKDRLQFVEMIKKFTLNVDKPRSLKEAQVSTGGVDTREVDFRTLESKKIDNLYFAGEVLDVDADSGGFNLQWAWSSGYVAGKSAAADDNSR